ncbi:MAG: alpha-amylase family glycosyl hydrolase [Ferruginibacter sp.]
MHNSIFSVPSFLPSSNIYAVNIRQYTTEGTFVAFANHLPRLKSMGVQILWFMPIYPIGKLNRKGSLGSYYSIQNFETVNPEFGTKDDFLQLVKTAHSLGFKIILDWVANHAAWDNVWAISNPNYFIKDDNNNFVSPYDWTDVIQINHKNIDQQQAMMQAMQYWVLNFGIDGFRADLAHLTPLQFWIDARRTLAAVKNDLIWLAETEEINYHQAFDISFTWQWMHAIEEFVKKQKSLYDCVNILKANKNNFPANALRMFFTSNHDENSWSGTEYEKYGIFAKALAVFSCTYLSVPLIYSGQELPNTKRLQFFEKDTIAWNENIELFDFYKTLYALRQRNNKIYNSTNTSIHFFENYLHKNIFIFQLKNEKCEIVVFLNFNDSYISENIEINVFETVYKNLFSDKFEIVDTHYSLGLEAASYCVLEKINTT